MSSLYGKGVYGQGVYSASPILAGGLAPTVALSGTLRKLVGLAGNLAPAVVFGPATLASSVDLAGDLAPQTGLGAALTGDWTISGDMAQAIAFAAQLTSGPLWAASPPCASAWEPSTSCPPAMWTPSAPPQWELPGTPGGYGLANYGSGPYNYEAVSDASPWRPSELCNG